MRMSSAAKLALLSTLVLVFGILLQPLFSGSVALAQQAVDTPTTEPPSPTPVAPTSTSTPVPAATSTPQPVATNTPRPVQPSSPGPVPIPEPITVVLFGTGLAALSAAAAARRKKGE